MQSPLYKSLGIAASFTKLLGSNSFLKSLPHGKGSFGGEDILYGAFKYIAEGNITLVVKATRNHRAVNKDAEVVTEAVAEHLLSHILA